MNFIELHIGDWVKNTRGLSMLERGVYMELVLAYYTQEGPFQSRAAVYRIINPEGLSRQLREAVDNVLQAKFQQDGDTFMHDRCDQEIHRYQQKQPAAEQKRANNAERQKRYKERRSELFAKLRELGITPTIQTPNPQLEAMLHEAQRRAQRGNDAGSNAEGDAGVTHPVTRYGTATSPQSPVTSNSSPERASLTDPRASHGTPDAGDALALLASQAAEAMQEAGLEGVNASDPVLREHLRSGVSIEELRAAAAEAVRRGHGPGWALGRAEGRRQDAAKAAGNRHQEGSEGAGAAAWQDSQAGVEAMAQTLGLGKWVQILAGGRTEHWPAYKARVLAAYRERHGADAEEGADA